MSDKSNPQSTAERIMDAALQEFAEHGFAGARVDRIAKRAECNKQLLYYHYGGKEELWREVLSKQMLKDAEQITSLFRLQNSQEGLVEFIMSVFDKYCTKAEFNRLALWERLEFGDEVVDAEERRERMAPFIASALEEVEDDELRPYVASVLFGVGVMPHLVSQLPRLLTGVSATDPAFRANYARAVRWLVEEANREPEEGSGREGPPRSDG